MREMLKGRPAWVLALATGAAVACSATTKSPFGNSGSSGDTTSAEAAGTGGSTGAAIVQGSGGSTGANLTISASGAGGNCAGGCSPDFHQVLDCESHPV